MGVSLNRIEDLFDPEAGLVSASPARVLDIGCSNLHSGTAARYAAFIRARNPDIEQTALDRWARYAEVAGTMDPEIGGINGLWLGDLLTRAGMSYRAFDIFKGFKTETFDLNHQQLEPADVGAFDVVLNFGTTEHLIGQYNAFKVMHEACAVGGIIYHDLPMTGYLDHGYFCYNPMLFVELAQANGYEVLRLAFSGGMAGESIGKDFLPKYGPRPFFQNTPDLDGWADTRLPTASVAAIFRKVKDTAFRASLETSTTVGGVTDEIDGQYGGDVDIQAAREAALAQVNTLLHRARAPDLTLDELMSAYNACLAAQISGGGFPPTLELRALDLALEVTPGDENMTKRRIELGGDRVKQFPLLGFAGLVPALPADALAFDGAEADFDVPDNDDALLLRIGGAYRAYDEGKAIELFPRRLEAVALEALHRRNPGDKDILIRLGKVMAEVLPEL